MRRLEDILEELHSTPRFMENVTCWREISRRPASTAPFPPALPPALLSALEQRGIRSLYTHQAEAVRAALAGKHVVIATPTASGKTLCYNLPVLKMLLEDPAARALYIFPTKALAQDQRAELSALAKDAGIGDAVFTYDGDTPSSSRSHIRRQARVLITNPDMLHNGILPRHTAWGEFFAGLRVVVLDELHAYRGIFGSHVANVLRRLCRIARFYGSFPQFICTSATIANPSTHARRLLNADVTLIQNDGAPRGHKHFIFYNPPLIDRTLGIRRSALFEARDFALRFLAEDIKTILFARSRLATEVLLTDVRDAMAGLRLSPDLVRGYRGGYLPRERRAIERGLRQGSLAGVVATNALELGIDIGDLAVAVLTGYPGSIASAWQQAGRAGRRTDTSAAILIAGPSPLDQYIIAHPEYIFERSPEHALIDPDNLAIFVPQLQCAAYELPFDPDETFGGGPATQEILSLLAEEGKVRLAGGRWHWASEGAPAARISLRTAGIDDCTVMDITDAERGPVTIGTVDRYSVPMLLHEGAIYIHDGAPYLVDRLDWDGAIAYVRRVEVDYYTQATLAQEVELQQVLSEGWEGPVHKGFGEVVVETQATAFKKVKRQTHEIIGRAPISLPPLSLLTSAVWYAFPASFVARMEAMGIWQGAPIDDYGPNWEEQRRRARQRDGYRCRQCGAAETAGRPHAVHHLRPFRDFAYRRGENTNYIQANALENLITLCPACHRQAEAARQLRSTVAGLAHVLRHVAPVHLMCDPGDLGVVGKHDGIQGLPTVFIYDRVPAGLGFSQALFEQEKGLLLGGAAEIIRNCGCESGCPSCVGPAGEYSGNVKQQVLALLRLCLACTPEEERNGRDLEWDRAGRFGED